MSVTLRWTGWSSSWLVLDRNTDDSLSKVSLPSGFGGEIGAWAFAASSVLLSRLACDWVPNSENPSVLHHMSMPPSATPRMVPNLDHSGLTLRTRYRSLPTAESRQAFSYSTSSSLARPAASAAETCSAASMPLPIAL